MKPRDGPAAEADLMKARSGRTPDLQPSPGKARYPPNGDIHSAISDVPLNVDSSRPHSAASRPDRWLRDIVNLLSRQRRKDWHSVRKGACVWIAGGAKALPGRPLAPASAPIRGSRR
jgi:hypothetical protein